MKVKYEFGKLTKDKATALAVKLGKTEPVTEDMALCDVYNLGTDNGGEQIESDRPKLDLDENEIVLWSLSFALAPF